METRTDRGILWIGILEAERLTCPNDQWLLELEGNRRSFLVSHNGFAFTSPFLDFSEARPAAA